MSSDKTKNRPLSPHLQVYRLPLTALMSISHRATGFAMAAGTLMVVWLLLAAATGPGAYADFQWFAGTIVGKVLLFGWSAALFYHMCNGVRHLLWDMGYLFKLENARKANYAVLAVAALLTGIFWWSVCSF